MATPHDRKRFDRIDPELHSRIANREADEETSGTSTRVLEVVLFTLFGAMFILAGFALFTTLTPSWRDVPNRVSEGFEQDRINILALGVGGEDHPGGGGDLADTMIVVSLRPSTGEVAAISLPRDLYVEIDQYGQHRINRAHQIGENSGYPGGGPGLAVATVEDVLGIPIHAFARIDFRAFKEIIDDIGGIEVYVERGFHDYLFDDTFEEGWQHMDGDRALRFARYRYVIGEEGDNFARERRQQKVMVAAYKKLRERGASDLVQLLRTAQSISRNATTNLSTTQIISLFRTFQDISEEDIHRVTLEPYTEIFEVRSIVGAGEAVRPRAGNLEEIRSVARNVFEESNPADKWMTSAARADGRAVLNGGSQ